jgi:RNA-directed DNA polymerase
VTCLLQRLQRDKKSPVREPIVFILMNTIKSTSLRQVEDPERIGDVSMQRRYEEIRTYLQGWMNYFGIALKYNDAVEIDHWLRRRIRMCYWKQWGRARRRIGELIKPGASRDQAILTGLSRRGYWHPVAGLRAGSLRLAKTLSMNCGLDNEFLQRQGLHSIRSLWIGIYYPAKGS